MRQETRTAVTQTDAAARRLAGGPLRDALLAQARAVVARLPQPPRLVIAQVGDDAASTVYVDRKRQACAAVGIACTVHRLPVTAENALRLLLDTWADDRDVTGVLVQLPLPEEWDRQGLLDRIPANKDVDGLTGVNLARLISKDACAIKPATPLGVMRLLASAGVAINGKTACVIGQSRLVGHPLALMLHAAGARLVTVRKETPQPEEEARQADILCVAAGVPGLVRAHWVKPGAVVVDVGITRVGTQLLGDVDPAVAHVAGWLTPVPGGVGPLTVASLLTNVIDGFFLQRDEKRPAWVIPALGDL